MDWIRVDTALPTHRKSIALGAILGEVLAWARMVQLWGWAQINAPDGRIDGWNPDRLIEAAVGWTGPAGAFIAAAVEVGFLDRQDRAVLIHDWEEHNGKALKRAAESAGRARRWREAREEERARQREELELAASAADANPQTHTERIPNAFEVRSRPQPERVPNAHRMPNETRRDVTKQKETTTAGPQPPAPPPRPVQVQGEDLQPSLADSPVQRLASVHAKREELRSMRAKALPNVVDDVELKPGALVTALARIEQEATAKGGTVADAYAVFLRDDYARGCNPPCPLGLFVDTNKFRECLSAVLRSKGQGPPLLLTSGRKAGGYVPQAEINAQDFSLKPSDFADHPEVSS